MDGSHLNLLISCIREQLTKDIDGIIVTHGTDTLPFTAAALGMCFAYAKVPILLVSSNYILDDPRANGLTNFTAAVDYITSPTLPTAVASPTVTPEVRRRSTMRSVSTTIIRLTIACTNVHITNMRMQLHLSFRSFPTCGKHPSTSIHPAQHASSSLCRYAVLSAGQCMRSVDPRLPLRYDQYEKSISACTRRTGGTKKDPGLSDRNLCIFY